MDFQSRINQFRQGLEDQQSSFNAMASSVGQMGRTVIPDRVAKHIAYMEQVGGMITGASAAIHGGIKMGKRVATARRARLAKQNPQMNATKQGEKVVDDDTQRAAAQKTVTETDPENQVKAPTRPDEPSDIAADAEGRAKGGKLRAFANEDEPEEAEGAEGAAVEDTGTAIKEGAEGTKLFTPQGLDDARAGAKPPTINPEEFTKEAPTESAGSELVSPETSEALKPISIEQDAGDKIEQGAKAFEGLKPNPVGTAEQVSSKVDDAATAVSDATDAAKAAGTVAKNVAKGLAEDAGEALGAEAIPFLGEAVGLGMLIHGIIKAHKHEENAPPPQLTAATPEASEQAGGFTTDMLKGSSAPAIF
jgi:hypothetical protein